MSDGARRGLLRRRMRARDRAEEHRVSTSLELFFDLCFVVAVSEVSAKLHHSLAEGHYAHGVSSFLAVFFGIWWAWMNFTWFASAFDTDDVPYRLVTLVQMAGVLVLAAGVPRAFDRGDFTVVTIGYCIMRFAMVGQWLRAARVDTPQRQPALRYAAGVTAVQLFWVGRLFLPGKYGYAAFLAGAALEMLVPLWAEWRHKTTWHPEHIAERYGLFTLIVLGESVLGATVAVQSGLDGGGTFGDLAPVALGGLLTVFAMWWLYFDQEAEPRLRRAAESENYRVSFLWGYGHYVIFGSAAAVGAGLEVAVAHAVHEAHVGARSAGFAVAIPVACYLLSLWILHAGPNLRGHPVRKAAYPATALLVLLSPLTGTEAPLVTGLLMAALVAVTQLAAHREALHTEPVPAEHAQN